MPQTRNLRPMTDAERTAPGRLARSRRGEIRMAERARTNRAVYAGERGAPVPPAVYMDHVFVDAANVDEVYPVV